MGKKEIKTISASLQALLDFNYDLSLNELIDCKIKAIHIDIMDATITPTFGINPNVLINKKIDNLIIDFHIMSSNPINLVKTIPNVKNCFVHTHLKMVDNYLNFINEVKKYNFNIGITIDLNDDITKLKNFINEIHFVNFMAVVNIGRTGEIFDDRVYQKIDEFKSVYGDDYIFCVDGSIREQHLKILKNKANLMVVGSILYKSENWKEKVFQFNKLINS